MNKLTKTLATATLNASLVAALAASFAAPAYATVTDDVLRAAATSGYINTHINVDSATQTGFVEDTFARQKADRATNTQEYEVESYLNVIKFSW